MKILLLDGPFNADYADIEYGDINEHSEFAWEDTIYELNAEPEWDGEQTATWLGVK